MHITAEATKDAAKDKAMITSKDEGDDFRLPPVSAANLGWGWLI